MKIKTTLLAAIALGTSGLAAADVTISIPDTIDVLVVNDAKPDLSGSFFSSKTLTLPNGENQILFTYQPYFDQGKDRVILESDPIIGTFNVADQELEFDLPKYRNENEGSKKIRDLEWSLKDESGQAIEMKQDKLVKEGMQIGRNHKIELAEYNRRGGIAAVSTAVMVPVTLPAQIDGKPVKAGDNTAEEMLHFWYSKADAQTQARFKAFVNQ
ncbi:DUF2057 family protein [Vibrio europaeus]|uniref:UPF0319 protein HOO69_18760 n=1 Tax=Vibrio europaeus TaxID=300876 RepID=A0AAE7B0F9_9VIBR|nr:DUF2057 family protein [Vibrio europaeus]MDC5805895.1 DUF2057 family protein [Vibrio europaeus]MDC5818514.1 DUF2057 family protein [Vibrio europaeus]MDC5826033.1 DUF2057 family protein [Vibrio europaeus]MDC5831396.1 DUF2057 family protein [Vibrio europaeus]MDC5834352.1 DUF2057 family protein [Vibrio europaeus]